MRKPVHIIQLVGYAPEQHESLGELAAEPPPVDDTQDPKKRLLLAGLLVGSFFLMAKVQKFL